MELDDAAEAAASSDGGGGGSGSSQSSGGVDDWLDSIAEESEYIAGFTTDDSFVAHRERRRIFDRIDALLQRLPAYDQVASRLCPADADAYMRDLEAIEASVMGGGGGGIQIDQSASVSAAASAAAGSQQRFRTRTEMRALLALIHQLAGAAAIGDCETARSAMIEVYVAHLQSQKQARQRRRRNIKAQNTDAIRFVRDRLHLWFPYPQEVQDWSDDPRTAAVWPQFAALIDVTRQHMGRERCLLQYVTKRRLTNKNIQDIERNMEAMRLYLEARHPRRR